MAIELPEQVVSFLQFIGVNWPNINEDKVRELNQLRTGSQSHLALGLFYAREGMIADAEREFGILVKDNPDSSVLKKLLKDVRSWRRR